MITNTQQIADILKTQAASLPAGTRDKILASIQELETLPWHPGIFDQACQETDIPLTCTALQIEPAQIRPMVKRYASLLARKSTVRSIRLHYTENEAVSRYLEETDQEFNDLVLNLLADHVGFERVIRKSGAGYGKHNPRHSE